MIMQALRVELIFCSVIFLNWPCVKAKGWISQECPH